MHSSTELRKIRPDNDEPNKVVRQVIAHFGSEKIPDDPIIQSKSWSQKKFQQLKYMLANEELVEAIGNRNRCRSGPLADANEEVHPALQISRNNLHQWSPSIQEMNQQAKQQLGRDVSCPCQIQEYIQQEE